MGDELALLGERRVRLRDDVLLLLVGVDVENLVGHLAVLHHAVGRLDEAVLVDLGVDAQRGDQADVRAFRRLDRADAAVVRRVHVAHLEARALTRQAAGAQRREAPLVRQRRQRVRHVHELAQLAAPEEVLDHRRQALRRHQLDGREHPAVRGRVIRAHALADQALRARQALAARVLQQLARRADAAVAQVVDVVHRGVPVRDVQQQAQRLHHLDAILGEHAALQVHLLHQVQALVHLVAAHQPQVVAALIKELRMHVAARVGRRHGIARAQTVVDVLHRLFLAPRGVDLDRLQQQPLVERRVHHVEQRDPRARRQIHQRRRHGVVTARQHAAGIDVDQVILQHIRRQLLVRPLVRRRDGVERVIQLQDVLVRAIAQRPQERRHIELPRAAPTVQVHPHDVRRVELNLDPRPVVRDDAHRVKVMPIRVRRLLRAHARAAMQLRHDHTLRPVDHERAVARHQRDLPQIHIILAHLVAVLQTERRVQRRRERVPVPQRLKLRLLRLLQIVLHEIHREAPILRRHREHFLEDGLQTLVLPLPRAHVRLQEIRERLGLNVDQVRRLNHRLELPEHEILVLGHSLNTSS